MLNTFFFLIFGSAAPFLLWPVEYFLPYPHIIEELYKYICLRFVWRAGTNQNKLSSKNSFIIVILFGFLFTLTESILYLMNLFILNQLYLFPKRLLITGVLHITTTILLYSSIGKSLVCRVTMILFAIVIHYLYNYSISSGL